jgi:hypothetical protein
MPSTHLQLQRPFHFSLKFSVEAIKMYGLVETFLQTLFCFVTGEGSNKARVFIPGRPFLLVLIFEG